MTTTAVLGQILALCGVVVVSLLLHRLTRLESTLCCLLCGFLSGVALEYIDFDTGIRAYNLKDLVFYLVLPVLVFNAAWCIKPALLKRWLLPVLTLSIPGVLISASVTAVLLYYGINHATGFPWIAAFLTGAILSATDPVAIVNQLRTIQCPADLTTLFEGESLFNDASVVVLFSIVLGIATGMTEQQSSYASFFAMTFLGGILFGLLCGLATSAVVLLIASSVASRFILVLSAFSSFYVAEHHLHVSGIMAVTICAVITRLSLREVENQVGRGIMETWEWLGLGFESLLFVVMGLVISLDMFTQQWLAIVIAIAAALTARAVSVLLCNLINLPFGKGLAKAWQAVLIWGGLRGAIAIALVLSLPVTLPYWWTIQSMVFGVVIFGLLAQGTTNKYLASRLLNAQP